MSKMDNLRAMREAKYAAAQKQAAGAKPAATRAPVAPPVAAPKQAAEPAADATEADTDELCGHRNMSGRTCTRERGHAAKSHRYS
ncbi:hypothetical protein [Nocardioides zhouii]|uniref:Uncharacterized protein n=1 Tax=Nocardioides zhouii TaxID=1168729 RepID=A0A4Q2STF8_9ACTN|nr:hypothetical protein [Nocardioides zhouii]RYC07489.1 hypothetical protein EUA94_14465 [Nocardioides zhouii]